MKYMHTDELLLLLDVKAQRTIVLDQLAVLKDKKAIPALCKVLFKEDTSSMHKEKILNIIVDIEQFSAIAVIEQCLVQQKDLFELSEVSFFCTLMKHLCDLGAEELLYLIIPYLSSMQKEIRQATLDCLHFFDWKGQHIQHKIRYYAATDNWNALRKMEGQLVRPIIALIRTAPLYKGPRLAMILAQTGDNRALAPILYWLFQPAMVVHHSFQIDEMIPYFRPLLGPTTPQILQAALFIDSVAFSSAHQIRYQYSLTTAQAALKKLEETQDVIAQKALKFVHLKQEISLVAIERKEKASDYLLFSFKTAGQ